MTEPYYISDNGIWYDYSFVPSGAVFTIYAKPTDTQIEIDIARQWLYENRDVVGKVVIIKVDKKGNIK